jgi:secreted PhoX family phosphatase
VQLRAYNMRINELVENIDLDLHFNNKKQEDTGFDIAEDLLFYMQNNDDVYRRHVYPQVIKHKAAMKTGKANRSLFSNATLEAYKAYSAEFPIKKLPSKLPKDVQEKVCLELYKKCTEEFSTGKK